MKEDYEKFKTIVECGSITEASKQLYISQPALSKYLSNLESQLNIKLIDRSSTPLTLTTAGKLFMSYIQESNKNYNSLLDELAKVASGTRGEVTLGINTWRGSIILPKLIPLLNEKYPNLQINIKEAKSQDLLNEIYKGNIEFCILNESQFSTIGMQKIELFSENIMGAASESFVKENRLLEICKQNGQWRVLEAENLINIKLILQNHGQNLSKYLNNWLNEWKVKPHDPLFIENIDTSINLASEGFGFIFIPGQGAYSRHMPNNLMFFQLGHPPLSWSLNVYFMKQKPLSGFCKIVIEELASMKELGY